MLETPTFGAENGIISSSLTEPAQEALTENRQRQARSARLGAQPQVPSQEIGSELRFEADRNQALADAKLLLRYAAEVGLEPKENAVCQIQSAQDANDQGKWTPEISQSFWLTYSALCTAVQPVTAESLKAYAGGSLEKTVKGYRWIAICLLVVILPLSIFLFVNTSLSNELSELIKESDPLALTLRDRVNSLNIVLSQSQRASSPPQSATPPPQSGREIDAVTVLQEFATTSRLLYSRANLLNQLMDDFESDPLRDWLPKDKTIVLELPVALRLAKDFSDAAIYKMQWYQHFRAYAKAVQQSNLVLFGAITAYVLPILYSLLGALAYALRALSQEAATRTYVPSSAPFARMIIAMIAGLVVGLFGNLTQGISLSPLAIAFLVGYGVERFFSLLDAFLETLKKVRA